ARPREAPRETCDPACTRRRCRRAASRGRNRRPADSSDAGAVTPLPPRAPPGRRPCPRGGRSSARRRDRSARPGRARPTRSRRLQVAGAAGTARGRARSVGPGRRRSARFGLGLRPHLRVLSRPGYGIEWPELRLESPMSERDTDIEFDFFDEPETEEATERVRPPRRPAGGGPPPRQRMRTPQGCTPMLRLAGLIAFLILAVIVLVFVLKGCASSSKHAKYSNYMEKMTTIGNDSAQLGKQLKSALAATGIKETDLEAKIRGFAATQQQQADQASSINAPGPLHTEHAHAIEVLQLRSSGLSRLADAFGQTATSKDASAAGKLLADQMRLLVASDVNWNFYFRDASKRGLQDEGVTDVNVPDSTMVANPDLASSQAMESVWRRVHGTATTSTPAGDHGSALVSVTALPDGKQLSTSTETTV